MMETKTFISNNSINLANLKHILKKQKEQVKLFLSKDKQGKNGIALLDEAMMTLIESNQSSFKVINLPKPEQLNLETKNSPMLLNTNGTGTDMNFISEYSEAEGSTSIKQSNQLGLELNSL